MPAQEVGRFRLIERVAEDAWCVWWRAVERAAGGGERLAGVRLLSPTAARAHGAAFLAAARTTFTLSHQALVALRDVGEHDGRAYVVSEWVSGLDLGALVARQGARGLLARLGCAVVAEAARGLDHAHRATGIGHGSLGPRNLVISVEGEVKVADFGIGRARFLGGAAATPGDDVRALGVLLQGLLGGRELGGEGLAAMVARAAAGAYGSAAELREDLEAHARREGWAAGDLGGLVREAMGATPTLPAPRRTPTPTPRALASPRAFNAALGGALAVLDGDEGDEAGDAGGRGREGEAANVEAAAAGGGKVTMAARQVASPSSVASAAGASAAGASTAGAERHEAAGHMAAAHVAAASSDEAARPRRSRWPLAGAVAAGLACGTALFAWLPRRQGVEAATPSLAAAPAAVAPRVETGPTAAASATLPPAPAPATLPPAMPVRHSPPGHPARPRHQAAADAAPARLTLTSDVAANAFVDGRLVHPTPLEALPLSPGRHRVRVESTAPGLRLLPREQEIDLAPGEERHLDLELK